MDRQNIYCANGEYMSGFQPEARGNDLNIKYLCAKFAIGDVQCRDLCTGFNDPGSGVVFLDRHRMQCADNEALKGFRGVSSWPSGRFEFKYTCCSGAIRFPTALPTDAPISNPTHLPISDPTFKPSALPTMSPTDNPVPSPTLNPTDSPVANPTEEPSNHPVAEPTDKPVAVPTLEPISYPTEAPNVKAEIVLENKVVADAKEAIAEAEKESKIAEENVAKAEKEAEKAKDAEQKAEDKVVEKSAEADNVKKELEDAQADLDAAENAKENGNVAEFEPPIGKDSIPPQENLDQYIDQKDSEVKELKEELKDLEKEIKENEKIVEKEGKNAEEAEKVIQDSIIEGAVNKQVIENNERVIDEIKILEEKRDGDYHPAKPEGDEEKPKGILL
jgi:hypothetical protein